MSASAISQFLNIGNTAFFLCDIQEKFKPAIDHFDEIVEVSKRLVSASKILDLPLIVTEQVSDIFLAKRKSILLIPHYFKSIQKV